MLYPDSRERERDITILFMSGVKCGCLQPRTVCSHISQSSATILGYTEKTMLWEEGEGAAESEGRGQELGKKSEKTLVMLGKPH